MQTGTILRNRYRILQKLGSGGFGETYLAEDGDLPGNPQCVVKHLKPKTNDPAAIPVAKRLFETEAETLYKLGQESKWSPSVFARFEEGGQFYLVQEYIDGEDLSKEVTPGKRLGESEVRELLVGILEVLEVTHRQKVIHGDIKPQNLIRRREDGKIVLIDFGAVKEIGTLIVNAQGQTSTTVAVGTPGYMPREQSNGRPKFSSDIYAVGMVGIQALTGVLPEKLPEDPETREVVWRDRVSVSKDLGDILEKMVRDHFSGRYQTATEALAAVVATAKETPFPTTVMPTQLVGAAPSSENYTPVTPPNAGRQKFLWWLVVGGMGFAGVVLSRGWLDGGLQRVTQSEPKVSPSSPGNNPPPKVTTTETFTTVKVNSRGEIIERLPGKAEVFTEKLGADVTLEMVSIPGGRFLMGSPGNEKRRFDNESPQHWVDAGPFFMGKHPVTQAQYQEVMGNNPSYFKGVSRPVEQVSWNDATEFCHKLSRRTGKTYRLPSEAQWEYACRAGTTTPFYFGPTITAELANYRSTSTYASEPRGIFPRETTDVGSFPPNAFNLYDIHGNVWEWCQDVWHDNYNGAPTDGSAWVSRGDSSKRLQRGGSWIANPWVCRSAYRLRMDAFDINLNRGFRVVLVSGL